VLERQPNADDINHYYPDRATRLEKTGVVTMKCNVNAQGRLNSCQILNEDPPGYEFGSQALKMAPLFKLRPQTSDGTPVDGGTWTTRIRFTLGE